MIGLPCQVVVQRCQRADADLVLRDDGEVWPPLTCIVTAEPASHRLARVA